MTRSTWEISDTHLTIMGDVSPTNFPERHRLALKAWLEHHGGDPMDAPLANTFTRDVDEHAIEYDVFERDEEGRRFLRRFGVAGRDHGFARRRHRLQLTDPPLPFPDEFQVQMP